MKPSAVHVKCLIEGWDRPVRINREVEISKWMKEYVGEEWVHWCWSFKDDYVVIPIDHAVAFRLKFGV